MIAYVTVGADDIDCAERFILRSCQPLVTG